MSDLTKRLCRPGYDLQKEQAIQEAIIEIRELRDKIAEMEKQEPVAWMLNCQTLGGDTGWILSWTQSGAGLCNRLSGEENEKKLYALPGAQAQPAPSVPDAWKKDLFLIKHAMAMNNWNWNSEASDDLKREAYAAIKRLLAAAPEAKP